jgi:WD40 repeat protein
VRFVVEADTRARIQCDRTDHIAVTAGEDGAVRVWSADTGELRAIYPSHAAAAPPIQRLAITADGRQIATAGGDGHSR